MSKGGEPNVPSLGDEEELGSGVPSLEGPRSAARVDPEPWMAHRALHTAVGGGSRGVANKLTLLLARVPAGLCTPTHPASVSLCPAGGCEAEYGGVAVLGPPPRLSSFPSPEGSGVYSHKWAHARGSGGSWLARSLPPLLPLHGWD